MADPKRKRQKLFTVVWRFSTAHALGVQRGRTRDEVEAGIDMSNRPTFERWRKRARAGEILHFVSDAILVICEGVPRG